LENTMDIWDGSFIPVTSKELFQYTKHSFWTFS
jgi:hypothetical protein